ncbi:15956_t:CDS:2 [Acaulospora colombiana]|uniref:15956_t:CDS:1 n=1 Tax=Acaulospora colombiana TaxID=27376 RepID=A0ACA9NGY0_9GLOM|nr:15956_t:CDS:2 [Acaulospora colombiana]
MDFINKVTGGQNTEGHQQPTTQQGGGLMDKVNNTLGGGQSGEQKEGVDMFQERVLGQGPQTNESAIEQAKDEQISDAIRSGYKSMTGKDVPIQDK